MGRLSVPTGGRLSSSLSIASSSAAVIATLSKLSRLSLIALALQWLQDDNLTAIAPPVLSPGHTDDVDDNEDDDNEVMYGDDGGLYPPCRTIEELRDTYQTLKRQKGSKRDIVDRIVEGDWRHGISLYQLATADLQYLREHPASQKWTAYQICPLSAMNIAKDCDAPVVYEHDEQSTEIPRFHPPTFVRNLQAQTLPDVKAHFSVDRFDGLPLTIVRIMVFETPYSTSVPGFGSASHGRASLEPTQTIYLGFPDASPHVLIARSPVSPRPTSSASTTGFAAGEMNSLRKLLLQGIPQALSRSRQRYGLRHTKLTSRNLFELLERKGPGRTNAAAGGWAIYADTRQAESPLDPVMRPNMNERHLLAPTQSDVITHIFPERRSRSQILLDEAHRRKAVAESRFGPSAADVNDSKGVERIDVILEDPPTMWDHNNDGSGGDEYWKPNLRLVFQGSHVYAGVRQLVESGVIDGQRMPGWLTGQDGITLGIVREGRIRGRGEDHIE